MARLLQKAGHQVAMAEDGQAAVHAYTKLDPKPQFVILDMDMPRLDGATCLRQLRELDPEARVVMSTGKLSTADERDLLRQGALAVLRKPYSVKLLLRTIDDALRRHGDVPDSQSERLARSQSPTQPQFVPPPTDAKR